MSAPWITGFAALAVLVVFLAVLVLGLLRRIAPVLERAERVARAGSDVDPQEIIGGLPIGAQMPRFAVLDADGEPRLVGGDREGLRIYLLVEPECAFCETLVEDLAAPEEPLPAPITLISTANDDGMAFVSRITDPLITLLFQNGEASSSLRTTATPYAFVVMNGLVVNRGHPNRLNALIELTRQAQPQLAGAEANPPLSYGGGTA